MSDISFKGITKKKPVPYQYLTKQEQANISAYLKLSGHTRSELAKALGLGISATNKLLCGYRPFKVYEVSALLKLVNKEFHDIFE